MKARFLFSLACAGAILWTESASHAHFLGLEVVNVTPFFQNHPSPAVQSGFSALGGSLEVYRVFANFSSTAGATDRVTSVHGLVVPTSLNVSGSLFNVIGDDGEGGQIHYNTAPPGFLPGGSRAWDTFVTINRAGAQGPDSTSTFINFATETNNLQTGWTSSESGWYITEDNPQGQASTTLWSDNGGNNAAARVLIMQLAVTPGTQFDGYVNLNLSAFGSYFEIYQQFFQSPIPSPPAIAVFAMLLPGALVSRRRRA